MTQVQMVIGGELRDAPGRFGVVNPATGEVHADAPDCSRDQLDEAFAAASAARAGWQADLEQRRDALRQAAAVIDAAAERIGPVLTAEQGKPVAEAIGEVRACAAWLRYFAELEVPRDVIQDDDRAFVEVVRRPVGVVAVITPWNFPVLTPTFSLGPALLAGNTVVMKPSPYTPRSPLLLAQALAEALPAGVVNAVTGGDELGQWTTSHPTPRTVAFTGSVESGKHVAAAAAPDLKRVHLELGGNDPAILLDDADPVAFAEGIARGAFMNCGQVCTAIKRLYVPETLYDEVVDLLTEKVGALSVGDGMEPGTDLGPIQNKPQFTRVTDLVAEATAMGAQAVTGGSPMDRPGYFFEPTVLVGASEGVRIVDEEQFGPALPVLTYKELDEVVDRANATTYGLSGSVWSADPERAAAVAGRLECGTAWVNTHTALAPHQPFGGHKWSGIGAANGPWGLEGVTDLQVVHRAR